MSDDSRNGVSVLHSVSGRYAEVHISYKRVVTISDLKTENNKRI